MANSFYNPNQQMINQLMRQKDNVENLISQYSQPPVQNIINTGTDFEARIVEDEDVNNILISKRTMFLDKKNKKIMIKELDGRISEEYEIIVPLDEKDKRIIDLEERLKEMEAKFNEYAKPIRTNNEFEQPYANDIVNVESTTKTNAESISRPTTRSTGAENSRVLQQEWNKQRPISEHNQYD